MGEIVLGMLLGMCLVVLVADLLKQRYHGRAKSEPSWTCSSDPFNFRQACQNNREQ